MKSNFAIIVDSNQTIKDQIIGFQLVNTTKKMNKIEKGQLLLKVSSEVQPL